ncbi:MAG: outer membrane protein assembly factor BamB family protein [Candidatus Aminicenantales bacterium]
MKIDRFGIAAGLAVAAVWAAACGAPGLKPADAWEITFPLTAVDTTSGRGPLIPRIVPGPAGLILLASTKGYLQAFDPVDPEKKTCRWIYFVKKASAPPVVSEGRIIWAADDGRIFRLDDKGKAVWTVNLAEPVLGEMGIVGTEIVFREGGKVLSALDPEKGGILWRTEDYPVADWMADKTRIIIRTTDNHLKIVHPNGRLFRDIPMAEEAVGSFGLYQDHVYTGLANGRFALYDLENGKKRWTIHLGTEPIGRPVSDGKTVYVVLSGQILAALDASHGDLLWWRPLSGRGAFTPRIEGDFVYVASLSDKLQSFSRKTGEAKIAYAAIREIVAPVEIIGTTLVVVSNAPSEDRFYLTRLSLAPPAPAETTPAK